ncbi:MAG: hypothetical protein QW739_01925 [Candidatus Odinarchaeota archaeon]
MVTVTKKHGVVEEFNPEKIYNTAIRAGAPPDIARSISESVSQKAYDGISTSEILRNVKTLLRNVHVGLGARYDLKNALLRLGPTGFPFENFISSLIRLHGYKTKIRQTVRGKCVNHEIDVIAEVETAEGVKRSIIECKFRNESEGYVGLKEAMYTYARFLDISEGSRLGTCECSDDVWLVCNSKASDDAIQYSNCRGVKLITWNYPPGEGLRDLIHRVKAYPVTVLSTLNRETLAKLGVHNIILVKELKAFNVEDFSSRFKIKKSIAERILQEAEAVLTF